MKHAGCSVITGEAVVARGASGRVCGGGRARGQGGVAGIGGAPDDMGIAVHASCSYLMTLDLSRKSHIEQ